MDFKPTESDKKLMMKILRDFANKNKTEEKCPYCKKRFKTRIEGTCTYYECETESCFHFTLQGI